MTLLEIALVACPSSSVGFVLGALWHARPSTDEAYPLERRRPSMAAVDGVAGGLGAAPHSRVGVACAAWTVPVGGGGACGGWSGRRS
jgi:hypothetical protein